MDNVSGFSRTRPRVSRACERCRIKKAKVSCTFFLPLPKTRAMRAPHMTERRLGLEEGRSVRKMSWVHGKKNIYGCVRGESDDSQAYTGITCETPWDARGPSFAMDHQMINQCFFSTIALYLQFPKSIRALLMRLWACIEFDC